MGIYGNDERMIMKQIKNRYSAEVIFEHDGTIGDANLCGANLSEADLGEANLYGADLCWANLYGANIDYSCLPFRCTSLRAIVDDRIRIQYLFHAAKMKGTVLDDDLSKLMSSELFKTVANKFHRAEECGRL